MKKANIETLDNIFVEVKKIRLGKYDIGDENDQDSLKRWRQPDKKIYRTKKFWSAAFFDPNGCNHRMSIFTSGQLSFEAKNHLQWIPIKFAHLIHTLGKNLTLIQMSAIIANGVFHGLLIIDLLIFWKDFMCE